MRALIWLTRITVLATLVLGGCAGGANSGPSGGLEVKLRRVDVDQTRASFDELELLIIAAVENGTGSAVNVGGGDAKLTLAGKAKTLAEGEAEPAPKGDESDEDDDDGRRLDDDDEESDDGDSELDDVDTSGIVTGEWVSGTAPAGKAPGRTTTEVPIRVKLKLPEDGEAFERLSSWGRMALDIKGTLVVGGKTYAFGGLREVATPFMPKPVLEEAQIASVDQGVRGEAFFRMGIDNPNVFDIKVDKFAWSAHVGGKLLREPQEGQWENVPATSVASFEDTLLVNEETFGPDVKKLLKQPKVPYLVEGVMVVKGVEKPFRFEGEMEFAR